MEGVGIHVDKTLLVGETFGESCVTSDWDSSELDSSSLIAGLDSPGLTKTLADVSGGLCPIGRLPRSLLGKTLLGVVKIAPPFILRDATGLVC
jgi:hypothetical protein